VSRRPCRSAPGPRPPRGAARRRTRCRPARRRLRQAGRASDRTGSRKVRTPPGSSPRGCHLGRNAARGHDRPRPLHPVTSRAAPPNTALPSTRVRQSERRRPRPPDTRPPRLNVPPGAGLVMRGGKQRGAWLDSWSSRCLRLGAGDGFGDGTGVSVFPAAAPDDALDPPAVRRAEHVVRVRAAQQAELAVLLPPEQVLSVHIGVADGPAGIAGVELDDVVGADVLGRGELAQCDGDQRDQVRAGAGRGGIPPPEKSA